MFNLTIVIVQKCAYLFHCMFSYDRNLFVGEDLSIRRIFPNGTITTLLAHSLDFVLGISVLPPDLVLFTYLSQGVVGAFNLTSNEASIFAGNCDFFSYLCVVPSYFHCLPAVIFTL